MHLYIVCKDHPELDNLFTLGDKCEACTLLWHLGYLLSKGDIEMEKSSKKKT